MSSATQDTIGTILANCPNPAAGVLLAGVPGSLTSADVAEIEQHLLNNAPARASLRKLLESIHGMIGKVCPEQAKQQVGKVAITYPAPDNPFAGGTRSPHAVYGQGEKWLSGCLAERRRHLVRDSTVGEAAVRIKLYLVAAVLEFEILGLDAIPALIHSLQSGNSKKIRHLLLHRTITAVPLALPSGGGEQIEERLLIAHSISNTLLRDFLEHSKSAVLLGALTEDSTATTADTILARLDARIPDQFRFPAGVKLPQLIEAACKVGTLRMPPTVIGHRSREYVSHGLRLQVLKRIGDYDPAPLVQTRAVPRAVPARTRADEEDADPNRPAPEWLIVLRQSVKRDGIDRSALQKLAKGEDLCGRRMGEYALWLSTRSKSSGVHRYVFLIAARLMPRFESGDPADVDEDTWEEVIEQVLDEDEFFRRADVADSETRRRQGHSQPLLRAMHSFIRFLSRGKKDLQGLHKKIPAAGILKVDANLVTVDEYKAALAWLGSIAVYPDAEMIEASRVALILGYRCGLRRAESGYLRLGDFDAASYLHVRPWTMRKLKTTNALRDLPLHVLIPEDELAIIRRRIAKIRERAEAVLAARSGEVDEEKAARKATRTWRDALLFPAARDPFRAGDFEAIVARVHESIRVPKSGFPGDPDFHYHILRHSFANMLLLKLWPALHPVARRILHRQPETSKWIRGTEEFRRRLFGTDGIRSSDLQAIALLMGHGSSATTLEHYLHVMDWYRVGGTEAESNGTDERAAREGEEAAAD